MTLDEYLDIGETRIIGSHTFTADEIKVFAKKFDPQPFHVDEEAARHSLLGGLCASGWHTAAMWMRCNLLSLEKTPLVWRGEGPAPVFGPSPGFENLRWIKPVYAGDTITYTRTNLSHRALATRPGWRMLSMKSSGFNQKNETVIEFDSTVLIQFG